MTATNMTKIIVFLVATYLVLAVAAWENSSVVDQSKKNADHCACIDNDCGCCEYLNFNEMNINGTVCANFTYLPNDFGISITITYNTFTLVNETVSARNPPPMCFGIPEMEKVPAHICVRFYDLRFEQNDFHGCVKAIISLYHVIRKSINLGCFNIPRIVFDNAYTSENHELFVLMEEELKKLEYSNNDLPSVNMI